MISQFSEHLKQFFLTHHPVENIILWRPSLCTSADGTILTCPSLASAHFSHFLLVESLGIWPQHLLVFQQDGRLCTWTDGTQQFPTPKSCPAVLTEILAHLGTVREREGLDSRSWRCREFKRQKEREGGVKMRSWQILCYTFLKTVSGYSMSCCFSRDTLFVQAFLVKLWPTW